MVDLTCRLAGMTLRNPILTASGPFGSGPEYEDLVDLERLGAVVVKGLTLHERPGNPPPRTVETPSGMLNAIGLQNPGARAFIADKLPYLRRFDVPVIVNLNASRVEEFGELAALFEAAEGVAALEVNISCPNVKHGGMAFSADPSLAAEATATVRRETGKPLIVKLSPNVTDLGALARAVEAAGADAVSAINTLLGMSIDIERRRPVLANVTGGLSGPAVRPVAVRCVWECYRAVGLPLIGMGGVSSGRDAVEMMLAGAAAVAVGTANFIRPRATLEVLEQLTAWLTAHQVRTLNSLVGAAHGVPNPRSAYHLE
ncbi:MAG: dihydroorotate dehydrogenase [Fimbriimonadaceae bacterium]|nr:dihydroorotate dehydrogenase [Fimbriimonadaceae bacterium]